MTARVRIPSILGDVVDFGCLPLTKTKTSGSLSVFLLPEEVPFFPEFPAPFDDPFVYFTEFAGDLFVVYVIERSISF